MEVAVLTGIGVDLCGIVVWWWMRLRWHGDGAEGDRAIALKW